MRLIWSSDFDVGCTEKNARLRRVFKGRDQKPNRNTVVVRALESAAGPKEPLNTQIFVRPQHGGQPSPQGEMDAGDFWICVVKSSFQRTYLSPKTKMLSCKHDLSAGFPYGDCQRSQERKRLRRLPTDRQPISGPIGRFVNLLI